MSINAFVAVAIVVLSSSLVVFFTAYGLGRAKEKNKYEKQKSKTLLQAHMLRNSLDDPDVVRRLHNVFRR